jgi:hypothetical protein
MVVTNPDCGLELLLLPQLASMAAAAARPAATTRENTRLLVIRKPPDVGLIIASSASGRQLTNDHVRNGHPGM